MGKLITADQFAEEVLQFVCNRVNVTLGTRDAIRKFVADKVTPLAPRAQADLTFEDQKSLEGQSKAILELLKKRRSQGAMNHELAAISLKYTSRVSDLRREGFKIQCVRESGRSHRYVLFPADW